MLRSIRIWAVLLASGLLVAGCGVRGQLQLPKAEAAKQTTATADSGQGKPANTAPKPHKDFILDGLLR
jgi:predicted small lipoprotein YifL